MALNLLAVFIGGGIGAVARYLLSNAVVSIARDATGSFPLGTLCVNVAGCLLIGVGGCLLIGEHPEREPWRLLLLVGVLGGFTTFSTFGWEMFELLRTRAWMQAGLYIAASNIAGIAAVALGYWACRAVASAPATG